MRSLRKGRLLEAMLAAAALSVSIIAPSPAAAVPGPGTEGWTAIFSGDPGRPDTLADLTVAPDGSAVYITGVSVSGSTGPDVETIAYDAASGAQLWASRYDGRPHRGDRAVALALAPSGSELVVVGKTAGWPTHNDILAVAYDATTGARLWVRRIDGRAHGNDAGADVTFAKDGATVLVSGTVADGPHHGKDILAAGLDPATGSIGWRTVRDGSVRSIDRVIGDVATCEVLSPGGRRLFVGAAAYKPHGPTFEVAAFDPSSGALLWARKGPNYTYPDDVPYAIAVAPDGSIVAETGSGGTANPSTLFTQVGWRTSAFRAGTGANMWTHEGYGSQYDPRLGPGRGIAFTPDGSALIQTGGLIPANDLGTGLDYGTVATGLPEGGDLWKAWYDDQSHGDDVASALALSPDGSLAFTTGSGEGPNGNADILTIALNTTDGSVAWTSWHDPGSGDDAATAEAVSPDGSTLYLGGWMTGADGSKDFVTIAIAL